MPETECYNEKYRPQFHFTARENWMNDPNGCVFYDGTYHLFFQHNPKGLDHGNMTWGHAVSTDLVHWRQLENAILPYDGGTIYSGSAVVDTLNNSKLGTRDAPPLITAFTHARKPFGQAIAFSKDHGRSWELYDDGKHVVPNQGLDDGERDPKIFRHDPSGKWIMVLWVRRGQVRFFTSDDLLQWHHVSDFDGNGFYECPDLVQFPLDGDPEQTKWVLYDAALSYWIGSFDGTTFEAENGPLQGEFGNHFYAAQTWNGTEGRVVQIGWMRGGEYPGMPFNQQMSFPCELFLRTTPHGIRLCRMPVEEIATLHVENDSLDPNRLEPGKTLDFGCAGDLFDVEMEVAVVPASSFSIRLHGHDINYSEGRVECLGKRVALPPSGGVVSLRILVDRTSIEIFGNGGMVSMSSCFLPTAEANGVQLYADREPLQIRTLKVHRLSSVWTEVSNKTDAGDA